MNWKHHIFSSLVYVVLGQQAVANQEPLATDLIGTWVCRTSANETPLTWQVARGPSEGWLTGKGYLDGQQLSLETWAFNDQQQLEDRRQFAPQGVYIHMQVESRRDSTIVSTGHAMTRDDEQFPLRHTLTRQTPGELAVLWQIDRLQGDGLQVLSEERCHKANG